MDGRRGRRCGGKVVLRAAVSSDVGRRRRSNEDACALAPDLGLYLVADGMGGHSAGQVASRLAAQSAEAALRRTRGGGAGLGERLRHAVANANREVFGAAQSDRALAGMGTTVVALLAGHERIALAHVGDSRAYRVRGGRIHQLTADHSLVAELVRRGEISHEAAREHPHRHVLTRALGVRSDVEPDVEEFPAVDGDVYVLCSDGLTGHVSDDEIAELVSSEKDPSALCATLIALANARGGEDNITVLVARCEKSED
jgi:protein phosphatase